MGDDITNRPPEAGEGAGEDGDDRRREARARIPLLIQFRFDTFDDFVAEYARDISPSGMLIRTDDPRPVGTMIYLQFALRDGSKIIEALGQVVRLQAPGSGVPAGMGIEFVHYDEESREVIGRLVAQAIADAEGAG
jgi:molecular chaperone DnaK